jgi:DNA-binding NtrC family response regulator
MSGRVLITMDDLEVGVPLNAALEDAGLTTAMVSSLDDLRAAVRRADPEVVVFTGALHERPARDLAALARDRDAARIGLFEPGAQDPGRIVQTLGLSAWLVKPVAPAEVATAVQRLIERRRLQERTGILGDSPAIHEVLVKIEQMAPVSSTVLIEGESGTGKELAAQAMHSLSPRRERPFIAVNCAALPETLLESELFGHEKGAFTGAAERRLGRFELANGGTLFLDEVGEMPPTVQVKLLRVLETRSFFRVGGTQPIHVDVRVIAATNRPLKEAVAAGEFREDLYFRLNVLSIYLPPLRDRPSDITILVRRFVRELSRVHGREFRGISAEAMEILMGAPWPGNVRQLRNLIESMVVLAPGREIGPGDIPPEIRDGRLRFLPAPLPESRRSIAGQELEFIFRSLVELKMQIEDLRRRLDDHAPPAEVIDLGRHPARGGSVSGPVLSVPADDAGRDEESVVFRPGMTMAQVEKSTIVAALEATRGNRRRAAEQLGIGERTLYRKIREYGLT